MKLDRRQFLGAASALIAAGVIPKSALALAGPHTFKHGVFDVTVLSDGSFDLPIALINSNANPDEVRKILDLAADANAFSIGFSPVILSSGSEKILFDTGTGGLFGPSAGALTDSLGAAGLRPDSITKVVFTHLHLDHCGGTLTKDGTPLFRNATHYVAENELNFWTATDLASKMPKEMEAMINGIQGIVKGFEDKLSTFKTGTEIFPGVGVIDTNGHTPGHVSFEVAGGDGLILSGDAITIAKVYFAHPDWKFGYDIDGEAAAKSRRMVLDMGAAGKKSLLGYHFPYPSLAHVEAKDGAYVYVPA